MDRKAALRRLPAGYARALQMRDEGLDDPSIADRLDIASEAVRTLLYLAEAKLARLLEESGAEK